MNVKSSYLRIFAAALLIATVLLTWFGYRAISEWQHSTRLVADRRAIESLYLLVTALTRDMRGVQTQVLPQLDLLPERQFACLARVPNACSFSGASQNAILIRKSS